MPTGSCTENDFAVQFTLLPPPPPAPNPPTPLPYGNYAGYSAYPANGSVGKVQASWNVPNIGRLFHTTCPVIGFPRAGAWVGMWGGTSSINNGTAYLPQIGTVSQCDNFDPSYSAVWEIPGPHGNGVQTIRGMTIHANDKITASVAYLGTSRHGVQEFELWINDTTDRQHWRHDESTSVAVPLSNIARQGGAVVEYEPGFLGGLARFSPSVDFTNVFVDPQKNASSTLHYYQYVMRWSKNGPALAMDSALTISNGAMNYSITWKAQN